MLNKIWRVVESIIVLLASFFIGLFASIALLLVGVVNLLEFGDAVL